MIGNEKARGMDAQTTMPRARVRKYALSFCASVAPLARLFLYVSGFSRCLQYGVRVKTASRYPVKTVRKYVELGGCALSQ